MGKSEDRIEAYLQERRTAAGRAVMLMAEEGILKQMTTEEMAEQLKEIFDALEPKRVLASMEMAFGFAQGIDWAMKHPFKRRWRWVLSFGHRIWRRSHG